MSKFITLKNGERTYKLAYTKESIRLAERRGLKINQIFDEPFTQVPLLFQCAFIANHKFENKTAIDEMYEDVKDATDLIGKLMELYNEQAEQLLGTSEDANKGKKITWEASC